MERTLTESQVVTAINAYKNCLKRQATYYSKHKEEVKRKRNLRYANSLLAARQPTAEEGGVVSLSS